MRPFTTVLSLQTILEPKVQFGQIESGILQLLGRVHQACDVLRSKQSAVLLMHSLWRPLRSVFRRKGAQCFIGERIVSALPPHACPPQLVLQANASSVQQQDIAGF